MAIYQYIDQCDRFRTRFEQGETYWQAMMASAVRLESVDFSQFNGEKMLDEGETLQSLTYFAELEDQDSGWFSAMIDGRNVVFFQNAGFEFIFMTEKAAHALGLDRVEERPYYTP